MKTDKSYRFNVFVGLTFCLLKMSPPKSRAWAYFVKKEGNLASCKVCGNIVKYSGNTSNLFKHLRSSHQHIEVSDEKTKEKGPSEKRRKDEGEGLVKSESGSKSRSAALQPSTSSIPQTTGSETTEILKPVVDASQKLALYQEGGSKYNAITQAILFFICKDLRPFAVVEGVGFKRLVKLLAPSYNLPAANTFKTKMNAKYEMCALRLRNQLSKVNHICLTTDIWTDTMNERAYLGVTLHFVMEGSVNRTTVNVGVKPLHSSHTGETIKNELDKVLEEWEIPKQKIILTVTDNGSNMVLGSHLFNGKNRHITCFAHSLNLVVEKVLKHANALPLLLKVRAIVKHVKNSVNVSDRLRKMQLDKGIPEGKIRKLILDVATWWNSTFYMAERFIQMASMVNEILLNDVNGPEMLTSREMVELKDLQPLLRPFEYVTKKISGEKYTTLSKIIPTVNILRTQLENVVIGENPIIEI